MNIGYIHTPDDEDEEFPEEEGSSGLGHNHGMEEDDTLSELQMNDLLTIGREELIKHLIKLMRTGQATPSDLNNLRQMLKDNGMIMGDPFDRKPESEEKRQRADLPQLGKPDYNV